VKNYLLDVSEKITKNILRFIQKIVLTCNFSLVYIFDYMDTNLSVLKFSLNFGIKNQYVFIEQKKAIRVL